jgi:phenylpropionate dioxygenase-like ring-hydroxylating dioxygenase large terminal subunit
VHIWQIACRANAADRNPIRVIVNGRPIVVFRAGASGFAALEDRCAHRNAPLSRGRICEGRLVCSYHGWEYDRDGRVTHVPALSPAESPNSINVERFHTVEQDGFVWVAGGDCPPANAPPRFAGMREPGWTCFTMQTRFRATIEASLENFLDCPHAAFVHRHWFRTATGEPVRVDVRTLEDGAVAEFFAEPRKRSLVWWLLAPRRGQMRHTDRFIAPSMSRVDYEFPSGLRYIISSFCTERTAHETEVFTVIAFRWGWLGPLVRLYFEPLSRYIIRQDVKMLAAQHETITAFGTAHFVSTRADVLGRHIVAWRQALRSGTAVPAAGATESVSIHL